MEKTPGKNLIKVPSVIMLIGGLISIITSLDGLSRAAFYDSVLPIGISWGIVYTYFLLGSIYQIFYSVNGIKHCNILEKASKLRTLAIIGIVVASVTMVMNMIALSALGEYGSALMSFFGLTLPIIFLSGANKNVNAHSGENFNENQY